MIAAISDSLSHAMMITGFVFVMMLVIEYLNVLTEGIWQRGLRDFTNRRPSTRRVPCLGRQEGGGGFLRACQ